jgi:4-diphosphocytidyl-2-C-methyl-D-erythritol kinase
VNLCLRIVGRRADGYHLLDSIFAEIDLVDRITVTVQPCDRYPDRHIAVSCAHPGVPNDSTNLAARAADALLSECGVGARIDIAIEKRIPPGGGLGGGSSNAATVLRALNTMLNLRVPERRLAELALALGADVPFFLTGGCARVRGIGERIDPINGWPNRTLVVAVPAIEVSTAWAFRAWASGPGRVGFAAEPEEPARLAGGAPLDAAMMRNDLEATVLAVHPELGAIKRALCDAGAEGAVMSGSGASVIGLVPSSGAAESISAAFAQRRPDVRVHVARIVARPARPSVDRTPGYA